MRMALRLQDGIERPGVERRPFPAYVEQAIKLPGFDRLRFAQRLRFLKLR